MKTRVLDISRGPTVTRYEVQPLAGVKISRITNLADDIALNLAAAGVRIEAPIPGKPAVGIEVPNKVKSGVGIRGILESSAFQRAASPLTLALGKLSDVTRAVETIADEEDVKLNSFVTVADVNKVRLYMKNFGEFYNDQVSHASTILLSRTGAASEEKIEKAVAMLREKNPKATIVTTDWNQLTGAQILKAMESEDDFVQALLEQARQTVEEHEHHHHYDENGVCSCGHHHDEDEHEHDHEHEHHHDHEEEEHEHHHHDHDECGCDHDHEHEHHHDHDGACSCGCGHDHHHHHADEVFTSWGKETARKYTEAELNFALESLDSGELGAVLRAKGIVPGTEGQWFHFDYVPGEHQVRTGTADVTGRLCVIGSKLDEKALDQLFKL